MHSFFGRIVCAEHASDPQRIQSGFLVIKSVAPDTTPPRLRRDQVCLGVWASMKAKASGQLDVHTQGKQGSDCRNNARTSARKCEFNAKTGSPTCR